ncbi:bifunctional diguanylate cyclase/phosphodiesterase [Marinomonas spartinae]|uniref:bifunctional diguanylate cyclase/phosphodiesterase n=1 Tax=Marinomonas spartinae TaxID=1792290 RepID=UPI0018F1A207|nr:bifunctional diguanylate cyclase/phosphodiesterase [Marinomonas spartinae]MBJ7554200.1 EAL domain-containing protein [Marinomonas spartinae]
MLDMLQTLMERHLKGRELDSDTASFIEEISQSMQQQQQHIQLLERSLELASNELYQGRDYLHMSQELFDATFHAAKDAMLIIVQNDENCIRYNQLFASMWRLPASYGYEITPSSLQQFMRPAFDDLDTFQHIFNAIIHHDQDTVGEIQLKDGRYIEYECRISEQLGNHIGRLWTMTDITERKLDKKALEASAHDLRLAHRLAKMGAWTYDIDRQEFRLSAELLTLLDISCDKTRISANTFFSLVPPQDKVKIMQLFSDAASNKQSFKIETTFYLTDEEERHVVIRGGFKQSDSCTCLLGVLQDVSDSYHTSERIKLSSRFFQSSLQGNILLDRQRNIVDFNDVACEIFHLERSEFASGIMSRLSCAWTASMSISGMWSYVIEHGSWSGEVYFSSSDLSDKILWLSLEAYKNSHGKIVNFIAIVNDITESKKTQEKLHQIAYFDSQTRLPNRLQFERFLSQKLRSMAFTKEPLVLIYLDLDRFKYVNDSLGHHAGDALLTLVGERLRESIPDALMIARQGGDEFVLILSGHLNYDGIAQRCEKIVIALSSVFMIDNNPVYVGASLGVVELPKHTSDMVTAMRYADISLYKAKSAGKGCYRFWQSEYLTDVTPERMRLESELRKGIENGELELHYQPKVEAETGQHCGLEALVRWQHPRLGLLYPNQFISIAEETNLIIELDRWVIRAVAHQQAEWRAAGFELLPVSINVSATHASRHELVTLFADILAKYPYLANYIEIELTETAIMANPDQATLSLNSLLEMGVKSSVDDFGSGYTSLGYLKKLNANTLKIDRSFINGITTDFYDRDVAKAIIALANSMSMEVVAEGIETKAQWDLLREFGCQYLQGFYFSRPLTVACMTHILKHRLQESHVLS